jgi:hypothetical protein
LIQVFGSESLKILTAAKNLAGLSGINTKIFAFGTAIASKHGIVGCVCEALKEIEVR